MVELEVCSVSDQSGYPVIHPKFDRIRIDPVDDRMDHRISGQSDICKLIIPAGIMNFV